MTSRLIRKDVETAYDGWAEAYDVDENPTRDLDALALRQQHLSLDDADVLEVGCGTGKNTEWLAVHARAVLALDFSAGMLRRARERVRSDRVRFVRHDMCEPWPFPAGSFDVVIADLVLEHVEDLDHFFDQGACVLRPGGRLFHCELHPFKQQLGSRARFIAPATGSQQRIPAFRHQVSEYLNAGLRGGLKLVRADEWREEAADQNAPPRLFSLLWAR